MKWFFRNKIALLTGCGFSLVIVFLWLDEIMDLPARFFHAQPTPINVTESLFETIVIFILATLVITNIFLLDKKVMLLKREKAKILSIISHDLKNIFTGLIGNSRFLNTKKETLTPEESQELTASIYSSSKRIVTLMENLLYWSKLHSDLITLHPIQFNLADSVQNTISILHTQTHAKDITLSHAIEPMLTVFADKDLIESVIHNLVHNAVKFTPRSGKITIQAIAENNVVEILISDNGIGLSPQDITQLTQQKPVNTRRGTEGEKGSGLGLYVCQEFIQRHHGKFQIKSRLGQGTTITFTLPGQLTP